MSKSLLEDPASTYREKTAEQFLMSPDLAVNCIPSIQNLGFGLIVNQEWRAAFKAVEASGVDQSFAQLE
jgi:thiamine monophosphate synthase